MARIFIDGFDKYSNLPEMASSAEWTASTGLPISTADAFFVDGLVGPGKALRLKGQSSAQWRIWKTFAAAYSTLIVGFHIRPNIERGPGVRHCSGDVICWSVVGRCSLPGNAGDVSRKHGGRYRQS
jgi:hypothetical protein